MAMAASMVVGFNLLNGQQLTDANESSFIGHTAVSSHRNGKNICTPLRISMPHDLLQRRGHALKATKLPDILTSSVEGSPIKVKSGNIPVIDMDKMRRNGDERKEVLEEIRGACEEWGFFHVVNHGVGEEVIQDIWEAYHVIMSYRNGLSPKDQAKMQFSLLPTDVREMLLNNTDAVSKLNSLTSKRNSVQLLPVNPNDGEASPNLQWIPHPFRAQTAEFYKAVMVIAKELLEAISESMGLPKDTIYKVTGSNEYVSSSMHYYEPSPNTSLLGFRPHKDPSTITILLPDPHVIGLQVLKGDHWIDVKPMEGSLIVNLGLVLEALTNGKYKSSLHRVTSNSETSRSSIASFIRPSPQTIIETLPQFIDDQNPNQNPTQSIEDIMDSAFAPTLQILKNP